MHTGEIVVARLYVYFFVLNSYRVVFYYVFFFFKQKTAYEIRLSLVGSEMCIRDSDYVASYAHLITKNTGGKGAVREVIDLIIASRGDFDQLLDQLLSELR